MDMKKMLDFTKIEDKAEKMSLEALMYAIADCRDCVAKGCDVEYYSDELSVYLREFKRRQEIK